MNSTLSLYLRAVYVFLPALIIGDWMMPTVWQIWCGFSVAIVFYNFIFDRPHQ